MTQFVQRLLEVPSALVYVLVGLIVFAEDAIFVGFVIPGETAAILGGVAASQHKVSLPVIMVVVVLCAIAGDSVGYEVGKHFGPRVLEIKPLQARRKSLDDARDFLARRGGLAVLLGRWTAFFRAVMPALAGLARMPYRKFLFWNAAGGVLWGVAVVLVGYLGGKSYDRIASLVGKGGAVLGVVVVVAFLIAWRVYRHRQERAGRIEQEEQEEPAAQ